MLRAARFALVALLLAASLGCERRTPHGSSPSSTPTKIARTETKQTPSSSARPVTPPVVQLTTATWPKVSVRPGLVDKGIYPDLDDRVRLVLPAWLSVGPAVVIETEEPGGRFVTIDGVPVGLAPSTLPTTFRVSTWSTMDRDGDGIPDPLDILIGAKKAVLNGAAYKSTYRVLPYPGGDMPRTEGVCTDVVVRALRNAGFDLQKAIHEDAKLRPSAYPGIEKLDRSIDHRRVRNLFPYFKRYWTSLPVDPKDQTVPWLPGDIVFLDTMNDSQPEYLGVVSDRLGTSGLPLIINNWTNGTKTAEMDLLSFVPVRGRFRVPMGELKSPKPHAGPEGLLLRRGLQLEAKHRQMVLVTLPTWSSSGGRLSRYARENQGTWHAVGQSRPIVIGANGLGKGRGRHDRLSGALPGLEAKREGDLRSPAGAFDLGAAFGPDGKAPYTGTWPWKSTKQDDRWVDDPSSSQYNTWQREGDGAWRSAEDLSRYDLAIVVKHNASPVTAGAGSAIFIHVWSGPSAPTSGCTALSKVHLTEILGWLDPAKHPLFVQVAGRVFE